jgi:hypothetical protein
MTSLYEISARYQGALEFLTDPENDVDADTIRDTMEGLDGEFTDKVCNVAQFVVNLENTATGIEEAEKRMRDRRKAIENKAARLRDYLRDGLQTAGMKKAQNAHVCVSLAKLPASVRIVDEAAIPPEFWREKITREPNKTAIKDAGGCPGAPVVEGGYRVAIK